MKGSCDICGTDIEVTMCCSGRECGCMGMPTEPPVCSDECYDKYMSRNPGPQIDGPNTNYRVDVNIPKHRYDEAMEFIQKHEGKICHNREFKAHHHLIVRIKGENNGWDLMTRFK